MRASGAAQLARRAPVGSRPLKDTSSWSQTRVSASARQPRVRSSAPRTLRQHIRSGRGAQERARPQKHSARARPGLACAPAPACHARVCLTHYLFAPHPAARSQLTSRNQGRDISDNPATRWNSPSFTLEFHPKFPFCFPPRCFSSTGFRSRGRGRRGGGEGWRGGWSGTRAGWSGTSGQSGPR